MSLGNLLSGENDETDSMIANMSGKTIKSETRSIN